MGQWELFSGVELPYCLKSNDMSVTQVTEAGHVTVLTMEELKVTKASYIYGVSQEERTKLREGVLYVKLYRYNPKHLCPKLNGY